MWCSVDGIFKYSVDVYTVPNNTDPIPCCILFIFTVSKLDEHELQTKKKSGSRQACNRGNELNCDLCKSIGGIRPDNPLP